MTIIEEEIHVKGKDQPEKLVWSHRRYLFPLSLSFPLFFVPRSCSLIFFLFFYFFILCCKNKQIDCASHSSRSHY